MSETHVRLEIRERVAHLTLARPEHHNALSVEMAEELAATAASIADEPGVGAVLLSGEGSSFCVGGDVKSFSRQGDRVSAYLRPTATALHPVVALPRRRATSLLSSGRISPFVFAWKNPVTFIVAGIATTKQSSMATIMHRAPRRPHHSSALRMASSGFDCPWT